MPICRRLSKIVIAPAQAIESRRDRSSTDRSRDGSCDREAAAIWSASVAVEAMGILQV